MELSPASRELTTFYTHEGLFRFKRLVMGAGPASQEFHEKFRLGLQGLQGVIQIEDDILVFGKTCTEHDKHLQEMLTRLEKLGVTLSPPKCQFNIEEVAWFGFLFNKDGMKPDPKKVAAIHYKVTPKSVAEVKSFLQMCQYNQMFLFDTLETYSDVTAPLRALLRKDARFAWTPACETAFCKIKAALTSEKVMAHWCQDRDTELIVDRGPEGLAATLYQKETDTGFWKPVNYTSRTQTKTEQRYSQIEGESLAIHFGVTSNRMYLYGFLFIVITEHQPLTSLYNNVKKAGPARVERHKLKLQGFDFKVIYRSGSKNPVDFNSRHPLPYTNIQDLSIDEDDDVEIYINSVVEDSLPDAITLKIMQRTTNDDDVLAKLKFCILHKGYIPQESTELDQYRRIFQELSVIKQLVMRGNRIVVPISLQVDLVALGHLGHQGATKMKKYLRSRVWFPKMDKAIEDYVESCLPCLASTPSNAVEPIKISEMPDRPWQKLAMDFKGPIGKSYYFFLVIDEYSRFPEVEIVESTSAQTVLPKLDRILGTHGIPDVIKSDNGPPFNSHDMEMYAKKRGFYHHKVEPEHPASNGLAENFMRMLRKVAHTAIVDGKDPRQEVNHYLLQYRATPT